ncbi:MAG: hypothetical protein LBD25_04465 [Coriobacteriales bacterium]|jgi:Tfp pilus assembly PilM family ATPase|nr:hypothetical protein [Coriobacteriales bacterium]
MELSLYCSSTHFRAMVASTRRAARQCLTVEDFLEVPLPEDGMINGIITDTPLMTSFFDMVVKQYGNTRGTVLSNVFRTAPAYMAIHNSNIQTRIIEIPRLAPHRAQQLVEQEFGLFDDEERRASLCDYAVLDPALASGGMELLAVSVERAMVEAYRDALVEAGICLKGINIGINCVVKLVRRIPALAGHTFLLSTVDHLAQTVSLFVNGSYRLMSRYRLLGALGSQEYYAETAANINALVHSIKAQRGHADVTRVVFSGVATGALPFVATALAHHDLTVEPLDLTPFVRLAPAVVEAGGFDPGAYVMNIGSLCGTG